MREVGMGVALLVLIALVLQSCRASHYHDKAEELARGLASEKAQVAACGTALEDVNAATADAEQRAATLERRREAAVLDGLQAAQKASARERELNEALDAARRDPDCDVVLSSPICPRVPLL